ncbi:MAG: TetR/AcrR family transcriptional regulator [Anaerolineales bacterium]|jgi:AcrR family transcriptional regulator|uniref:TetR/AcrR family transcriptional regulator n=1 Tax=Candidatus Villigracilis affinis TaxID=3140682 RepID=UPI001B7B677F|nr:TetR/AcrR family transcriptional regulator [Anaerolineales bacterium]MBK9601681.1 TetR/AcrR family transcriptional regulator [Anaerolineales bacterium]MBL0345111.1 TetR/AcrR family transcriptional regulator [Anaerolineales bacterium]MBP8047361.1 TetR/AcrR family transcriptional regulator [Anaerolineales bacterium]
MTISETGVREEILAVAMRMFIQQGYHGLAMRQISEAVGVSKAALYYYFKDKEELFLAILNSYLNDMESSIDAIRAKSGSSADQITQFVESVLRQPAEQRALTRLASQEMGQLSAASRKKFDKLYHEKFIGKLTAILQEGMDRGEFQSLNAEIATWSLLGIMYPYFYPAHSGEKPIPAGTIQEIVSIYLNGVKK